MEGFPIEEVEKYQHPDFHAAEAILTLREATIDGKYMNVVIDSTVNFSFTTTMPEVSSDSTPPPLMNPLVVRSYKRKIVGSDKENNKKEKLQVTRKAASPPISGRTLRSQTKNDAL